ncbi:MAG: hypothetical protein JXB07_15855 [Anaerolineae bacterium]|nr:hypothetical protein [Anaerolineae bacterium]
MWVGPRLSFRPLIDQLGHSLEGSFNPSALGSVLLALHLIFPFWQVWEALVPAFSNQGQIEIAEVIKVLDNLAQSVPDRYLNVLMPSMVAGRDASALPFNYVPPVWQIQTPLEAATLRVALFLIGFISWMIYGAIVAQRIREDRNDLVWLVKHVPVVLLQMFLLLVVITVICPMLLMVLSVVEVLGSLIGLPGISVFLLMLIIPIGTWIAMFAAFTIHGMFMNDRNIFTATWDSLRIVQWNVSSTLGLFMTILILIAAMQCVKGWLDAGSWLMAVAIAVNAFLCTGLLAATFVFFKDRYRHWRELREELLAELERRRIPKN